MLGLAGLLACGDLDGGTVEDHEDWDSINPRAAWTLPPGFDYAVKVSTGTSSSAGTRDLITFRLFSAAAGVWGRWHTLTGLPADTQAISFLQEPDLARGVDRIQIAVDGRDRAQVSVEVRSASGEITAFTPVEKWVTSRPASFSADYAWTPPPDQPTDDCFCVSSGDCINNYVAGCGWHKQDCDVPCWGGYVSTTCYGDADFTLTPATDGSGLTCMEAGA